jgi:hypothetical protein
MTLQTRLSKLKNKHKQQQQPTKGGAKAVCSSKRCRRRVCFVCFAAMAFCIVAKKMPTTTMASKPEQRERLFIILS